MDLEEMKAKIQYLKDVKGLSFRQIERETGISREKSSRIYSGNWEKPNRYKGSYLDTYRDLISHWFKECPSLKAVQVYQRLQERGIKTAHRSVARYTKDFRRKKTKVYWPLEFLPGEEGQVDWFFVTHPKLGKLCGFALILSYSRYLFVHLFPRHSFEFFIEGHLMAFQFFGGYPHALRYDNLRSVVLKKQPLTYNSSFLEFAHHYGFEIRLCNPASGNEKGRVERVIRSLRETFFNIATNHLSLRSLNCDLQEWVNTKNNTIHRATGKLPSEKKEEEKLKPLPQISWKNMVIHIPKLPTKTGLLIFDTNSYSIPTYLGRNPLIIHVFVDHLEIYTARQEKVASHSRCFKRYQTIINSSHRSFQNLSLKAKQDRIYAVIKRLDVCVERFLEQNQAKGEDHRLAAYQIFKLLKNFNHLTIISAIRETLKQNSPNLKTLFSLLEPSSSTQLMEKVVPQNQNLLQLDYMPRNLEDYHDEK